MKSRMLVSAEELLELQRSGPCLIVDCRFSLAEPETGLKTYLQGHIPGAVYANLDIDLSSPVTSTSGRHPLPSATRFSEFLAGIGWRPGTVVVAYDDIGGAFAARLWWLMKYFGHNQVALLDGGYPAWRSAGYATACGDEDMDVVATPRTVLNASAEMVLTAAQVADGLANDAIILLDARAPERYRGDVEPLDSEAGHVPGAKNLPFALNLGQDNKFKPLEEIRNQWQIFKVTDKAEQLVHMCGSGVTACFNQFAVELAGIEGSRIYAGSWSEWIRDPARGIETG